MNKSLLASIKKPIFGSMVALVTPMLEDGGLDLPSLQSLIEWQIDKGTNAIVIVGTSGESPTVSIDEHCTLIKEAVECVAGRVPVIAGAGGNSTFESIELTKYAKEVGADASLQVAPYYNNPTQEGIYLHFKTIAEYVDLPMILYNVPGRTVADISNETILRLANLPGVIGVKDATCNIERGSLLMAELRKMGLSQFSVFSGDDLTAPSLMLMGAKGNISVTANVAPHLMSELCLAAMNDDSVNTRRIQYDLLPLHKSMFTESNPIPVKWALHEMGKISPGIRLPLTPLDPALRGSLRKVLNDLGLIKNS